MAVRTPATTPSGSAKRSPPGSAPQVRSSARLSKVSSAAAWIAVASIRGKSGFVLLIVVAEQSDGERSAAAGRALSSRIPIFVSSAARRASCRRRVMAAAAAPWTIESTCGGRGAAERPTPLLSSAAGGRGHPAATETQRRPERDQSCDGGTNRPPSGQFDFRACSCEKLP